MNTSQGDKASEFIITYSSKPSSFDPLDFDSINNFNFARMIYATPLEFDSRGNLISNILDSFSYDENLKLLKFVVKKNIFFQNGEKITADDLVLSIKRMLIKRPKFPVIEDILGVDAWLNEATPLKKLPAGISVLDNIVEIKFTRQHEQPMFRFTLELFSILPSTCFDLNSGKLICNHPSESGPYLLKNFSELSAPIFILRKNWNNQNLPKELHFKFLNLSEVNIDLLTVNSIIAVSGEEFVNSADKSKINSIRSLKSIKAPNTWHLTIKLNSIRSFFSNPENRKEFISFMRKKMNHVCPEEADCDSSFFSKLVSGYFNFNGHRELEFNNAIGNFKKTNNSELVWISSTKNFSVIDTFILEFCKINEINYRRIVRGSDDYADVVSSNNFDLFIGMTGFWSMDPYGDAKMLFTPNLHMALKDLWTDEKLQSYLNKLNNFDSENKEQLSIELNKYIYEKAIYNVVAHFSFMYFSKGELLDKTIPQSGTIPYPWFFF